MIRKIRNIVNSKDCYNFLNNFTPILFDEKNSNFLHHKGRLDYYKKKSKKTFEGHKSCGGVSYILDYYLKRKGIKTKMGIKKIGYGKYLEDHCFLYYDNFIIDPTYRQLFRINLSPNSSYYHNLYSKPLVFVGQFDDLENLLIEQNFLYYGEGFNNSLEYEDTLYFWNDFEDVTEKLDSHLVVNNHDYAIKKGEMFFNLNRKIFHYNLKNKVEK
jgi:hypothetical protein